MLRIAGQVLTPRLIVFDKDGTLIAFDALWHTWFRCLLEELAARMQMDAFTQTGLAETLGYDPESGAWDPRGPLTLASVGEVALLIAGQLYRCRHIPWEEALTIVEQARRAAHARVQQMDLVHPIGDVRGLFSRLRSEGLLLALATTDDRAPTLYALEKLGISALLATVVCGDDGIPPKPAPDMALEICRRLGVAPHDAIMLGDTVADLLMARQAGYARAIGVTSGAASGELLAPHADLVIPDIHAIEIIPSSAVKAP